MGEPSEVVQQFCSQCEKEVDSDALFCKYCAYDLNSTEAEPSNLSVPEKLPSTPNKIPTILASLAVIIIGLIALAIYLRSNGNSQVVSSNEAVQSISYRYANSNVQQTKANPATPTPVATVEPPAVSSGDGEPSEQMVEAAVRKAFGKLKTEGKTDSTPGIRVVRVQALSGGYGVAAPVTYAKFEG